MARARIYAQDAIRHKNEANNMLRMQSRMDGRVQDRVLDHDVQGHSSDG